ncbi:MAG: hypothetical protein DRP08_02445 [Candidatus Aenigmatarchaeota archaeon]|nr:MAG: hypothetical protein DRP08_02445 [Candidatus Aenigmarchaeota archaeon]
MEKSEEIKKILKDIKDPHTGKDIIDSKIIRDIKLNGKNVSISITPPYSGCAGCVFIQGIYMEIYEKLKKKGFEVSINFKSPEF